MSTPFQNRLVGTVIVAAVVIIFLPDLLDGQKNVDKMDFEVIPNAPALVTEAHTPPQNNSLPSSEKKLSNEFAVDNVNTSPHSDNTAEDVSKQIVENNEQIKVNVLQKTPELTNSVSNNKTKDVNTLSINSIKTLPEKAEINRAWVIHLGSFRHKQNVKELLTKLKENGYVVFTKPIETQHGTLTKVFIGPELIKSSLEKKLIKLKALTNVQGKVAPYKPSK